MTYIKGQRIETRVNGLFREDCFLRSSRLNVIQDLKKHEQINGPVRTPRPQRRRQNSNC
jgi:hypothetical protein